MLTIRIALGRWIFDIDIDLGPRPAEDDELMHVAEPELEFGFVAPADEVIA